MLALLVEFIIVQWFRYLLNLLKKIDFQRRYGKFSETYFQGDESITLILIRVKIHTHRYNISINIRENQLH